MTLVRHSKAQHIPFSSRDVDAHWQRHVLRKGMWEFESLTVGRLVMA